jgi:hypothetical protein
LVNITAGAKLLFVGNTITQTSLTGQLVFVDCTKNQTGQELVFAGNQISLVHSYLGTGVLKFIR